MSRPRRRTERMQPFPEDVATKAAEAARLADPECRIPDLADRMAALLVADRLSRAHLEIPAGLLETTFAVQHSPNCPSRWLIRLVGDGATIDLKPYGIDFLGRRLVSHETRDALGFGTSASEAFERASAEAERMREARTKALRDGIESRERRRAQVRGETYRASGPA